MLKVLILVYIGYETTQTLFNLIESNLSLTLFIYNFSITYALKFCFFRVFTMFKKNQMFSDQAI